MGGRALAPPSEAIRPSLTFAAEMALPLTPRLLRRGLQLFALISIIGVVAALVVYGNNLGHFVQVILTLRWGWVAVGLGLASMDWLGGGSRLWVIARHVHPAVRWRDPSPAPILRTCASTAGPAQTA